MANHFTRSQKWTYPIEIAKKPIVTTIQRMSCMLDLHFENLSATSVRGMSEPGTLLLMKNQPFWVRLSDVENEGNQKPDQKNHTQQRHCDDGQDPVIRKRIDCRYLHGGIA